MRRLAHPVMDHVVEGGEGRAMEEHGVEQEEMPARELGARGPELERRGMCAGGTEGRV